MPFQNQSGKMRCIESPRGASELQSILGVESGPRLRPLSGPARTHSQAPSPALRLPAREAADKPRRQQPRGPRGKHREGCWSPSRVGHRERQSQRLRGSKRAWLQKCCGMCPHGATPGNALRSPAVGPAAAPPPSLLSLLLLWFTLLTILNMLVHTCAHRLVHSRAPVHTQLWAHTHLHAHIHA